MLSRRGFVGCALCALTGFAATGVDAQSAASPGLKRTILSRVDGPTPGYETIEVKVEAPAGSPIAKHTHFGVESSYVLEGSLVLEVAGQEAKTFGKGDAFQVPPLTVHGGKTGDQPIVLATVYIVEKGKPLATPA
jgi:quercetin dioxygenase-like cupin family protein